MSKKIRLAKSFIISIGIFISFNANAWWIIMPNFSKPQRLTDEIFVLSQSNQTKALAFVAGDWIPTGRPWAWGQYLGDLDQKQAIKIAITKCKENLEKQKLAGKDFGGNKCELYQFPNLPESAVMPADDD